MKKLMNAVDDVLDESLLGMAHAYPELKIDQVNRIVSRAEGARPGKVGLVSGGGSGHEPMHAGFVGRGMLDAAAVGQVFTSPVPDQVIEAAKLADGDAGVVCIVKNYTGDVMNFEMAAELASDDGIEVNSVVIDDDVAVQDSLYTAGRRGVGATVLAEKIAGAAAEKGADLATVTSLVERVNRQSRSMGMALTSCTVPAAGHPTFDLGPGDMELGVGIHGEPGRERLPLAPAAEVAQMLAAPILQDLPFSRGDSVVAFVNGLGATPLMELYLMYNELAKILQGRGMTIARNLVGNYMTALDMAGCSFTLMRAEDDLLGLWDEPVVTPGMRWGA